MLPSELTAAIFDWDGTIVDSAESTFRVYRDLFEGLGYPFDHTRFVETYSPDWYHTYRMLGIPESEWEAVNAKWLALHGEEDYGLMEGAVEALERLKTKGVRLGVVTSGSRERVEEQARSFNLGRLFDTFVFSEDVVRKKPDPEGLRVGLEKMGLGSHEVVYLGDSPEDIQMAKSAGVFAIAIPGGFPNREALESSAPDLFALTLHDAVERLMAI